MIYIYINYIRSVGCIGHNFNINVNTDESFENLNHLYIKIKKTSPKTQNTQTNTQITRKIKKKK